MDTNFFSYLERLELMGFFVAYPLVYLLVKTGTGNSKNKKIKNLATFLPYSYALTGVLYLGLQLKNLYPDFSVENIKLLTENPVLKLWGVFSLLFWIPALAKKPVLSLLHSLVFFIFLARDLFLHAINAESNRIVQNDMNIFTNSFLLNCSTFLFVTLIGFLISRNKK